MDTLRIIAQIIIALGIANVWLLRFGRSTAWRGGNARNMREEFAAYGLPRWSMWAVGGAKLALAGLLLVGLLWPTVATVAAVGMAALMVGAVTMHFKAGDPPRKSLPAGAMLALSLLVALA